MLSKYKNHIFYFLSILWNLILFLFLFSTFTSNELELFFHSDLLSFPTLYKDMFVDGYSVFDWAIGGATYLVPDRIIYFSILAIFDNFRDAAFVFSIVQYFTILLLFTYLIKQIFPKKSLYLGAFSNFFFSIFIIVGIQQINILFTLYLFLCNYHIGAFAFTILTLATTYKYIANPKKKTIVLLFTLIIVSVFSDRMFLIFYSIPISIIFLSQFIFNVKEKISLHRFKIIALASFIGVVLHKSLSWFHIIRINNNYQIFTFAKCIDSFELLGKQMYQYIAIFDIRGIIILLSFIVFIVLVIYAIRQLKNKQIFNEPLSPAKFFIFYFILFFGITLIIQPLNGNYFELWLIRYIMAIFYMSILAIPIISYTFLSQKKSFLLLSSIVSLFLFFGIITMQKEYKQKDLQKGVAFYRNFVPKLVTQVDSLAKKYHLQYGVSSFFEAKVITSFSKNDLRVYSVFDNFQPWIHGCNKMWYIKNNGKYANPVFEYGVFLKNSVYIVSEKYVGKPISIDTIGNYLFLRFQPFTYEMPDSKKCNIVRK